MNEENEEYKIICEIIAKRLPIIFKGLSLTFLIYLCDFAMFTTQRAVNYFGSGHEEKSVFYTEPVI